MEERLIYYAVGMGIWTNDSRSKGVNGVGRVADDSLLADLGGLLV